MRVGLDGGIEDPGLHRHGKSIREIAREIGVSRNGTAVLRDEEAARYTSRPLRLRRVVSCGQHDPLRALYRRR